MTTDEKIAAWFEERAKNTPMPGTREMFKAAAAAFRGKVPKTNADRFRAMSDEELAEYLMRAHDCELHIPFCQNKEECWDDMLDIPPENCLACMLEWLRKEAEQ